MAKLLSHNEHVRMQFWIAAVDAVRNFDSTIYNQYEDIEDIPAEDFVKMKQEVDAAPLENDGSYVDELDTRDPGDDMPPLSEWNTEDKARDIAEKMADILTHAVKREYTQNETDSPEDSSIS